MPCSSARRRKTSSIAVDGSTAVKCHSGNAWARERISAPVPAPTQRIFAFGGSSESTALVSRCKASLIGASFLHCWSYDDACLSKSAVICSCCITVISSTLSGDYSITSQRNHSTSQYRYDELSIWWLRSVEGSQLQPSSRPLYCPLLLSAFTSGRLTAHGRGACRRVLGHAATPNRNLSAHPHPVAL